MDTKFLNDCSKPDAYRKLIFSFCFFHAIVQDRRKFGAIGWNIPYAFTFEDLDVCRKQLKIFLDDYDEVPFKVINFLGAEINYGGRVTDYIDTRLAKSIMQRFINPDALEVGFKYSESGIYKSIDGNTQQDYLEYISTLPLDPAPEAFGLHPNAEITTNQNATRVILENVLALQPRASGGSGQTREERIAEISADIESKVPPAFKMHEIAEKYPVLYEESMNTVLPQEVAEYNRLTNLMREMLINVQRALIGEVVMSEDLEAMSEALFNNQVPLAWQPNIGFLSLKPLASWIIDLLDRIHFLQKWVDNGPPATFWISGFFFPQAFFTGQMQNYARKHTIAID